MEDWSEDQWTGSVSEINKKFEYSKFRIGFANEQPFFHPSVIFYEIIGIKINEHMISNSSSQNPKCSHLQPKTPRKLKIPTA